MSPGARQSAFALVRAAVALVVVAAVVAQLRSSLAFADRAGGDAGAVLVNFFSYFTIESNVLGAVVLLLGAVVLARGTGPEPGWFARVRACAVTYLVITGIVYNVLLRGLPTQGGIVTWSNEVLHVAAPVYLLLDWLLAPGRVALPRREAWRVVAFPVLWAAYTLVRGPFATDPYRDTGHWYPYPFLDPDRVGHGYLGVAAYVVVLAAAFVLAALGVLRLSRVGRRTGDRGGGPA